MPPTHPQNRKVSSLPKTKNKNPSSFETLEFRAQKTQLQYIQQIVDRNSTKSGVDRSHRIWKSAHIKPNQSISGIKMTYSISVCINENSSAVFLSFERLSEEFRIVRHCRFQCIGWILSAVAQVEVEVQNGATWVNPEESVKALMRFSHIPEYLARKLIASGRKNEQFSLIWDFLSDAEKNEAITVNFDYFHNFWPDFQLYATAIALQIANTHQLDELKKECERLNDELENGLRVPILSIPNETLTPIEPINHIKNKRFHSESTDREVVCESPPRALCEDPEDIHY